MRSALNYAVTAAGARRQAGLQVVALPATTFEQVKQLGRFHLHEIQGCSSLVCRTEACY